MIDKTSTTRYKVIVLALCSIDLAFHLLFGTELTSITPYFTSEGQIADSISFSSAASSLPSSNTGFNDKATTTTTTTTEASVSSLAPSPLVTFQNFDHLDGHNNDDDVATKTTRATRTIKNEASSNAGISSVSDGIADEGDSSTVTPLTENFGWPKDVVPWPQNDDDDDNHNHNNNTLKVPFPIFVSSLPKSATTTAHAFFNCGGQNTSHNQCRASPRCKQKSQTAMAIKSNLKHGLAPLDLPPFDIFSDTGHQNDDLCFHPTFQLQMLYDSYPNMTILHIIRNTTSWYDSISRYHGGRMLKYWSNCAEDPFGVFPILNGTRRDFEHLYERHTNYVRTFVQYHPSITYIEFQLEDPLIGEKMQDAFGISKTWWRHANKNKNKAPRRRQNSSNNRSSNSRRR